MKNNNEVELVEASGGLYIQSYLNIHMYRYILPIIQLYCFFFLVYMIAVHPLARYSASITPTHYCSRFAMLRPPPPLGLPKILVPVLNCSSLDTIEASAVLGQRTPLHFEASIQLPSLLNM